MKNLLITICARGGSKGIPGKNIKPLNGKPLIYYTIDVARQLTSDENIYVSTDDNEIIKVVENYSLKSSIYPYIYTEFLATSMAKNIEVPAYVSTNVLKRASKS